MSNPGVVGSAMPPAGAYRVYLPMVSQDKPSEAYVYDADCRRVLRVTDTETTLYVNGQYEVKLLPNGTTAATKYYSFGGQRIAMRQGQGAFTYLHADHLGSTLAATDSSGNVLGGNQPRYYGYGAERRASLASLPTRYTYTGQHCDAGTGLMYYGADVNRGSAQNAVYCAGYGVHHRRPQPDRRPASALAGPAR